MDISNFSGRLKFKSKPCSIKFYFSSCIERIDHIYEHYHNFHCPAHCNFKMGKVHCTGFYIVPCASFGFVTLANVPLEWAASFGFALCSVQRIEDCKPQMCRIVFAALLCRALQTVPIRSADGNVFWHICISVYLCICVLSHLYLCNCVLVYLQFILCSASHAAPLRWADGIVGKTDESNRGGKTRKQNRFVQETTAGFSQTQHLRISSSSTSHKLSPMMDLL